MTWVWTFFVFCVICELLFIKLDTSFNDIGMNIFGIYELLRYILWMRWTWWPLWDNNLSSCRTKNSFKKFIHMWGHGKNKVQNDLIIWLRILPLVKMLFLLNLFVNYCILSSIVQTFIHWKWCWNIPFALSMESTWERV